MTTSRTYYPTCYGQCGPRQPICRPFCSIGKTTRSSVPTTRFAQPKKSAHPFGFFGVQFQWRRCMGVEPTLDQEARRATVLKTALESFSCALRCSRVCHASSISASGCSGCARLCHIGPGFGVKSGVKNGRCLAVAMKIVPAVAFATSTPTRLTLDAAVRLEPNADRSSQPCPRHGGDWLVGPDHALAYYANDDLECGGCPPATSC